MSVVSKIVSGVKEFFKNYKEEERFLRWKIVAYGNGFIPDEKVLLLFRNNEMSIHIDAKTGDVMTIKGDRKLKRIGLSDEEIESVLKDPRIKINKPFEWMD